MASCSSLPGVSPTPELLTHVSPTPSPTLAARDAAARAAAALASATPAHGHGGDTATAALCSRPLRLRIRKIEPMYLAEIEAGRKRFEVTQAPYLGTQTGWTLGWEVHAETRGELWIGLSPTGRQPSGDFECTHFCCLCECQVLDGVASWADVSLLRGSGVDAAHAAARDAHAKTQLDPRKPTFAWMIKPGSVHKLRRAAPIPAFCGPYGVSA